MNMKTQSTIRSTCNTLLAVCSSYLYAAAAMACAEQLGNELGVKVNALNAAEVHYLMDASANCARYKDAGKAFINTFDEWTRCIGVDQSAGSAAYQKAKQASGLNCS